jgi:hypothetical protein
MGLSLADEDVGSDEVNCCIEGDKVCCCMTVMVCNMCAYQMVSPVMRVWWPGLGWGWCVVWPAAWL